MVTATQLRVILPQNGHCDAAVKKKATWASSFQNSHRQRQEFLKQWENIIEQM